VREREREIHRAKVEDTGRDRRYEHRERRREELRKDG
jgi:hypothetical protein